MRQLHGFVEYTNPQHLYSYGATERRCAAAVVMVENAGPHIDDGATSRHVLHNLLCQADHAYNVHHECVLQALARQLCEVLYRLSLLACAQSFRALYGRLTYSMLGQ